MGVLNVTPDSFSDGGKFGDLDSALGHGIHMADAGADIIDVGGESTRPGAEVVPPDEQIRRTCPVIQELDKVLNLPLSIDTTNAETAAAAVEAGASVLNDVSGLADDPELADLAAEKGAGLILMHRRGASSAVMQQDTDYDDLFGEIRGALEDAINEACKRGVDEEQIVVDPGIGFGKTADQNYRLLAGLDFLAPLGRPIMIGVSRKSFLEKVTGRPAAKRTAETVAASLFAVERGATIHRVHDVEDVACALAVCNRCRRG